MYALENSYITECRVHAVEMHTMHRGAAPDFKAFSSFSMWGEEPSQKCISKASRVSQMVLLPFMLYCSRISARSCLAELSYRMRTDWTSCSKCFAISIASSLPPQSANRKFRPQNLLVRYATCLENLKYFPRGSRKESAR